MAPSCTKPPLPRIVHTETLSPCMCPRSLVVCIPLSRRQSAGDAYSFPARSKLLECRSLLVANHCS